MNKTLPKSDWVKVVHRVSSWLPGDGSLQDKQRWSLPECEPRMRAAI